MIDRNRQVSPGVLDALLAISYRSRLAVLFDPARPAADCGSLCLSDFPVPAAG
jgi:hypothetical protein